jgi:hypothetical protein
LKTSEKESNRNPGNKNFLKSNKKYKGKPLHQIGQVEDIISRTEDKIHIKEKTEELLDKRHKSCKMNMQELCESIKSSNLQIIGIEEGESQRDM